MEKTNWLGTTALGTIGLVMAAQGVFQTALADSLFIRDRNISVLERERPEFAADGIRAGQFIVKPRLDLGVGYTDNAFAISGVPLEFGLDGFEEESDTYIFARPSVRADSLWSRHSLTLGGYVDTYMNRRFDSESINNYGIFSNGQIDISSQAALFGEISFDHLTETRRANTSAVLTDEPIDYDLSKITLGGQHELGRIKYRLQADYAEYDFHDVDTIPIAGVADQQVADQDFRDRRSYSVLGKVGFAVSRDVSIFFSASHNTQEYDDEVPFDRDSEGWNVQLGADFDLTNLLRGSVGVGKFEQRYEDERFNVADGTSIDASLEWFPRERTTVSLRGRRGADESSIRSVGGAIVTEGTLRVDQEIRHNLIGYAMTGFGNLEYPDLFQLTGANDAGEINPLVEQTIERFRVGAGATFYHSKHMRTSLDYLYETQDVQVDLLEGGRDTDYHVNQLLLTLTLTR